MDLEMSRWIRFIEKKHLGMEISLANQVVADGRETRATCDLSNVVGWIRCDSSHSFEPRNKTLLLSIVLVVDIIGILITYTSNSLLKSPFNCVVKSYIHLKHAAIFHCSFVALAYSAKIYPNSPSRHGLFVLPGFIPLEGSGSPGVSVKSRPQWNWLPPLHHNHNP